MSKVIVALVYVLIGWALCGTTMGIGLSLASENIAVVAHAILAPLFFVVLSWHYFRRDSTLSPLCTAALFLGVIVALDVFVVATAIQRSFAMLASPLGTWLPLALIFVATWLTGVLVRRPRISG